MSYRLSRAEYVVAIVGGTGSLGKDVSNVFLSTYRPFFSKVIIVARDATSADARALAEKGAEIRPVNVADPVRSFAEAFEGVDVVVNATSKASLEYKNALFDGALKSGVRVYFPSEFGSDYRLNDFPGWDDPEWIAKGQHVRRSREVAKGKVKVIALYTGLFLEGAIAPYFGFDHANFAYTSYDSSDHKTAVTAKADIGRALAELSLLTLAPELEDRVPDDVHIAGENASYRQIRDVVQRVRNELGVEPRSEIQLRVEPLAPFIEKVREEQLKSPAPGPLNHIKILIAQDKMDFSENDNELINPGQKVWKWKTIEDHVRALNGKL